MFYKKALILLEQLSKVNKSERIEFFKDKENFIFFWYYHFRKNFISELAPFHFEWIKELVEWNKSILFEAFRWSLKTELIKIYLVYCICYKVEPYIVVQSYDSSWSEEMVRNVAKMLVSKSIVNDYGNLFPFITAKEDMAKKSITNFDTTNWIKVVSRSLWEKLRWAASFDEDTGSSRPTLLILDDIDIIDSVRNVDIINKNEQKILNETIWAMSKEHARIIFLGNTILWDWIVRRFHKAKINNPYWRIFNQPLYDVEWKVVWDFFTQDIIDKILADEWQEAFKQNYLLIPKKLAWMPVFEQEYIDKIQLQKPIEEIEWFKIYEEPQDELVIWIDVSEWWEKSDFMAIVCRNRQGKVVFTFKDRVNEVVLAQKLDFILKYEKNWKKYKCTILPENNTWLALINEMKKYKWFQFVLKQRNESDVWDDNLVQKYWFRTSTQSKDLIIREYKMAIYNKKIWITEDILDEVYTYQFDQNNRPNAIKPDHDDLLMADMIAYNWILHEPFIAKYIKTAIDLEAMTPIQRHLYKLKRWDYQE